MSAANYSAGTGLELPQIFWGETTVSKTTDAESDEFCEKLPPELAKINSRGLALPEPIRHAIIALINSTMPDSLQLE